jgi:hypothetical protein
MRFNYSRSANPVSYFTAWECIASGRSAVGQFDYGRIVNSKTDSPKRILGACQNPIIALVNAARFTTEASISRRRAKSAALNAPCAVQLSRTGTPLGFLDIDSLPVQLERPMTPNLSWRSRRGRSRTAIPRQKSRARIRLRRSWAPALTFHRPGDAGRCRPAARLIKKSSGANRRAGADLSFHISAN